MQINEPEKYLKELAKILSNNDIIKDPKKVDKLFETRKVHKDSRGNIVGWQIQSKEIDFWDDAFIDVDENVEKIQYNEFYSLSNCSYHFQPERTSETLRQYRIDIENGEAHANPDDSFCRSHLYSGDLRLKISMFNLVVSIYVALEYLKNKEKYPLEDQYSELYNNIIEGLEGKY